MENTVSNYHENNERLWRTNSNSSENEETKISGSRKNLNDTERLISGIGGGALAIYGLSRADLIGVALAALGGGLVQRSTTGHCSIYSSLGINTAEKQNAATVREGAGVKVEKSMTINASPEKLYSFWRNFGNLPQFMSHLESVQVIDETHSHWKAKAPFGYSVEWDAEIINDKPNEIISWRSTENADVANVGSVHFMPSTDQTGTIVKIALSYEPPAGKIGMAIAWLTGEEPSVQVEEDLRHFKQMMETGENPTTEGQTSGRK